MKKILYLVIILLIFGCSSNKSQAKQSSEYKELLVKLENFDPNFSFTNLRLSYTETNDYNPLAQEANETYQELYRALKNENYENAIHCAKAVLDENYLDIKAHSVCVKAYKKTGKDFESNYHDYVREGLLKSITSSGNGESPQNAYKVISLDEEAHLIQKLGYKVKKQETISQNGSTYDKLVVYKPENKENHKEIYINLDEIMEYLKERKVN